MSNLHKSAKGSKNYSVGDECHEYVKTMSKDLLKCSTCHESFNSRVRPPLMLPCYHAFCGQCLKSITKDNTSKCPICQRTFSDLGEVPVDITRLTLRLFTHGVWCLEGVPCEGCSEGTKASFYCQECAELLCESCSSAHKRVKFTAKHTVVCLTVAAKSPAKYVCASQKCERHDPELVTMYCVCCRKSVCPSCARTTHKECSELVPLESVLEGKKKEVRFLCDQLDTIEETFQAKLNVCLKSLETVDTNLRQSVKQVECVIGDLVSAALERQEELSEELRGQAKADKKELEEQAGTLRSLLSAAEASADYGRRIVILNLTEQVMEQSSEIEENVKLLKKETDCHISPVLEYQMVKGKLDKIKELIRTFGAIECASSAVCASVTHSIRVECPDFKLDLFHCGPRCYVKKDHMSLSNASRPLCQDKRRSHGFHFHGTCGTAALTGKTSFWQATCVIVPTPTTKTQITLCEVGVATKEALHSCDVALTPTPQSALTVKLYQTVDKLMALIYHSSHCVADTPLCKSSPTQLIHETIGFALDSVHQRLCVINVKDSSVLCDCPVDTTDPLWPMVSVVPIAYCSAEVTLTLHTGKHISLTSSIVALLDNLMGK